MYLTRFPLNLTRRGTIGMLASPYRLHAAIAGSFPSGTNGQKEGRVLWRVDQNESGSADLYIVSPEPPSLVGLDEQVGWPDLKRQWVTRDYAPFLSRLAAGQVYQFRLVANTVVSRKTTHDDVGRSKRLPHVTVLQRESWLIGIDAYEGVNATVPDFLKNQSESRAERNGFAVLKDEKTGLHKLAVSDVRDYDMRQGGKKNRLKLSTTRFDGLLEVKDAGRLRHALTHGIGHGKGFGCGLLTLSLVDKL